MGIASDASRQPLLKQTKDYKPSFSRRLINWVWPYILLARINGLVGVWLTFWPCTWGAMMAAYRNNEEPSVLLRTIPFLWLGCALLHSAACTINDIFDRDFDRLVERTKNRPLAAGTVSVFGAVVFLLLQTFAFLALLSLANRYCVVVTLCNLPLQFGYPLFKRITYWPSFFLGLTFSWGSLVGWSAITGSLDRDVSSALYIMGVCWAFGYDFIYGNMDQADDPKAGVKSTALILGARNKRPFLLTLYISFIVGLTITGMLNSQGPLFFLVTVVSAAVHVLWQGITVDFDDPKSCWARFYSNSWIGWAMWVGLGADYYLKVLA